MKDYKLAESGIIGQVYIAQTTVEQKKDVEYYLAMMDSIAGKQNLTWKVGLGRAHFAGGSIVSKKTFNK
jgi:hypothetical protein